MYESNDGQYYIKEQTYKRSKVLKDLMESKTIS